MSRVSAILLYSETELLDAKKFGRLKVLAGARNFVLRPRRFRYYIRPRVPRTPLEIKAGPAEIIAFDPEQSARCLLVLRSYLTRDRTWHATPVRKRGLKISIIYRLSNWTLANVDNWISHSIKMAFKVRCAELVVGMNLGAPTT